MNDMDIDKVVVLNCK